MPTTCRIEFENNPMKVIYAGQILRGTVQLGLTKKKNVRGVYICIYGRSHTSWSERVRVPRVNFDANKSNKINTTQDEYVWQTYSAKEDYINEQQYFVGGSSGEVQLMPGVYNYAFQCMLPANLPTSFEGNYGHIRYTAKVVLDVPMWTNKTFEVPFTVIKGINLNADPALRNSIVAKKVKTFGIFTKRSMIIDASTPVGGYAPGQTINLQINVNNQSKESLLKFSVKLVKNVTYYANFGHQKMEKTTINEQDAAGCDGNQNTTIRVNLLVPSVPPTDYTSSNIIKVVYVLHVKGTLGFMHSNPVLDLPIIIGSHPIQDSNPVQIGYPHSQPQPQLQLQSYPQPQSHPQQQPYVAQVQPSVVPAYDYNSYLPEKDLGSHQPTAPPQMSDQNIYPSLANSINPNEGASTASAYPYPYPYSNDEPPTYEEALVSEVNGSDFKPKYPMFKRTTSYSNGN